MLFLRSLSLHIFMAFSTVMIGIVAPLLVPFPYVIRYRLINIYALANIAFMKYINGFNYTVEGAEHLPPSPYIIFSKHQSTWETFALQIIFPPISFVFKQELFYVPFFGWGLAAMKPVPIKRGTGRKAVNALVKHGIQRLKEGLCVVIFPEGTRTTPTAPGKYKLGGAILAAESGYPVVPVAHNAGECWPRRSFTLYPGNITVRIGPAIDTRDKKPEDILAEAKQWIEAQMPEISNGKYSAK